eukprot:2604499-Amphidinium_carterae.1
MAKIKKDIYIAIVNTMLEKKYVKEVAEVMMKFVSKQLGSKSIQVTASLLSSYKGGIEDKR